MVEKAKYEWIKRQEEGRPSKRKSLKNINAGTGHGLSLSESSGGSRQGNIGHEGKRSGSQVKR